MDKIYSRKRIKIPKIKPKKINKFRFFVFLTIAVLIVGIGSFIAASYPIFIASCKTAAASKAVHIVNNEVKNIMKNYSYDDFVQVEKDNNDDVVLMKYNTVLINEVVSTIASDIQKSIDNTPRIMVYINYGSVSRDNIFEKFWTSI